MVQKNLRILYLSVLFYIDSRSLQGHHTLLSSSFLIYPCGNWVPKRGKWHDQSHTNNGRARTIIIITSFQSNLYFFNGSWSQSQFSSYSIIINTINTIANFYWAHLIFQILWWVLCMYYLSCLNNFFSSKQTVNQWFILSLFFLFKKKIWNRVWMLVFTTLWWLLLGFGSVGCFPSELAQFFSLVIISHGW